MSVDMLEQVETPSKYVFTGHDRCDQPRGFKRNDGRGISVSEQAYHRFSKGDLELFFCDHHKKEHEDALILDGWKQESDTQALLELGNPMEINA